MMRTIASKADPMGRDWNDRCLFDANYQDSPETRGRRHKGHWLHEERSRPLSIWATRLPFRPL